MATRRIDASGEIESPPLRDPDAFAQTESPVDLPDPSEPLPAPLRWTSEVIAAAALVLASFNANAIRGWAYQLDSNGLTARVVVVAEAWYEAADAVGLNQPFAATHAGWQSVKELRFGPAADRAPPPP